MQTARTACAAETDRIAQIEGGGRAALPLNQSFDSVTGLAPAKRLAVK
jgi:hypothetical protein